MPKATHTHPRSPPAGAKKVETNSHQWTGDPLPRFVSPSHDFSSLLLSSLSWTNAHSPCFLSSHSLSCRQTSGTVAFLQRLPSFSTHYTLSTRTGCYAHSTKNQLSQETNLSRTSQNPQLLHLISDRVQSRFYQSLRPTISSHSRYTSTTR